MVKTQYTFTSKTFNDQPNLNIAYGSDSGFALGVVISICSLLKVNPHLTLAFHIISNDTKSFDLEKLEALTQEFNTQINFYIIDEQELIKLPYSESWRYATYYRLILAKVINPKVTKLLYLDADVLCYGKIDELITLDLSNNILAAVEDYEQTQKNTWTAELAKMYHSPYIEKNYFNAGVLLINVPEWNRENVTDKVISLLSEKDIEKTLRMFDQDALNIITSGNVRILPVKFNYLEGLYSKIKLGIKGHQEKTHDAIFIHYVGDLKPWHNGIPHSFNAYFNELKENSVWKDTPCTQPTRKRQYQLLSRMQRISKHYIKALTYYFRYKQFK